MSAATVSSLATFRTAVHAELNAAYPELIARMGWSREQLLAHQRERLQGLLRHAMERSPFHARRLAGIDPAAVDPTDMSALPVMTKAEMMEDLDDVFTDRRLSCAEFESALAAPRDQPVVTSDR